MKNPKTLSIIWKHQSYNLLFLSMELHVLKGIYRKPTYVSKTLRLFYESNLSLLQENITSDLNISAMFFMYFIRVWPLYMEMLPVDSMFTIYVTLLNVWNTEDPFWVYSYFSF